MKNYVGCDIYQSGHSNEVKKADTFYDGHVLPFELGRFDFILATQVMEHVEFFDEIFKELMRVLKKEGNFIMTVPFAGEEHEQPYDFRRFTSFGIKSIFEKNGLELLEIRKSTNCKDTIRFMHCMYRANIYRKNKNIYNFIYKYLGSIMANTAFILQKSPMKNHQEDLGLNIFVVGIKKSSDTVHRFY